MLKQANRLNRNKDFNKVFKQGASAYGAVLGVKAVKNEAGKARVAILVSKKVSKRAVVRNLVKRRLMEIIRLNWLSKLSGYDLVITCQPNIKDKSYQELETELNTALTRLCKNI